MGVNHISKKIWHFLWHEDSLLSWLANLALAFVLVKWVIYPFIGLLLGTSYPIVAVVSGSMEHEGLDFASWWEETSSWYEANGIPQEAFQDYPFSNGFNKGDIMILKGVEPKAIKRGDILVYESPSHSNPIIHRVVRITTNDGKYAFVTKGDNNGSPDSNPVKPEQIQKTGKAIFRLPLLGWIKIGFVSLIGM